MMNQTIRTIQSLRTIHGNFSDRAIPEADLQAVLNCAVRAATASARQTYSIIVTGDKEKMKQLCGYSGDKLLVFCVDFTRLIDLAAHLGHDSSVGDIMGFITGSTDTILAAQTACICAKSLGIDSLFTNGIHRGDMSRVFTILGLPDKYCFPLIALVLGYPTEEPPCQKGRLSGPGVIHWESYHRLTPQEKEDLIAEYDNPERHLGMTDDWAREGLKHYLDWFYTVWAALFKRGDSSALYDALAKAGFLNKDAWRTIQ
jgi:FMN reductase [NAD(P)H]